MRTVTVDVTEADIQKGKRYRWGSCPIGLAGRRVGLDMAKLAYTTDLPQQAIDWAQRYDSPWGRQRCKPFRFRLRVPE